MQWRKSPQYQSMPHGEYMNTSEGQRAQQAFQQWGQWSAGQPAARPGQAQSQQSPWASSTTYNPQSAGGFGAYTQPARQSQAAPSVLYAAPAGWEGRTFPPMNQPPMTPQMGPGWGGGTFPPMGQPPLAPSSSGWEGRNFLPRNHPQAPPMGGNPPWMGDSLPPPPARRPVTRPQQPGRPSGTPGQYSGMPAGTPPSLAPFFEQAQQMFPGLDRFGQREAAYKLRNQQQAQQRRALQALGDQAMADWQAKQARYGQDIKDVPRRPRLTRRV